jgi:ketopantoate reductase
VSGAVVLIGVGEMGGVFARGLLRTGYSVLPVTRTMSMAEVAVRVPEPDLALVAVGEADLKAVLAQVPECWRPRLGLLQNELLPGDWEGLPQPTVISVWFEKKPGAEPKVIIPSPVYGPRAALLAEALGAVGIPATVLADADQLLFELVAKNLYILTSNLAGLRTGGTVGQLWASHQALARAVGDDVIDLQEALAGRRFDRARLFDHLARAFAADPDHKCMGRSAPARLLRALEHGGRLGLALPTLRDLQAATH